MKVTSEKVLMTIKYPDRKRGVSLMVSYALLVIVAVALSIFVYSYLKQQLPSERIECSEDVNLIIDGVICNSVSKEVSVGINNGGLFNVSAVFVRMGEEGKRVKTQLNQDTEIFPTPLSPGKEIAFLYDASSVLKPGVDNYEVEIQAAVLDGRVVVPCEGSVITQSISCGAGGGGNQECTDGEERNCPLQGGVCINSNEICVDGSWPGCSSADYGADYEEGTEISCTDGLDNDCDGVTDNSDSDCENWALNFDGIDDYVQVGTAPDFSDVCLNGCSFSAWVRREAGGTGNLPIVARSEAAGIFFSFYVPSIGESLSINIFDSPGPGGNLCTISTDTNSVPIGSWIHVTGVYNLTDVVLYTDGERKIFESCAITIDETAWQNGDTYIGHTSVPSSFFSGDIDDVRIYNRGLSDAEVSQLNDAGPEAEIVTSGLAGWWKFYEGSGNVAEDSWGDNDGSINGATWIAV
ncbi:LamG domain-containing protein [Candidatus Pacearchaeota archaeon]|nr:LamG domain-containing protein [Candidatus Pacearchaeota archaeon]